MLEVIENMNLIDFSCIFQHQAVKWAVNGYFWREKKRKSEIGRGSQKGDAAKNGYLHSIT